MKRHRQQMSSREIEALEARTRKVTEALLIAHAEQRMAEKGITARDIELTLKYGIAIEINSDATDEYRAVVRHAYGKPKVATCMVLGLTSGKVVTTWKNAGSDNHSTLNLYAYQWNVNVANLLEGK